VDEIRTERLVLRRAKAEDAGPMHRILSDAVAMRFWSTLPHQSMAETEAWIASMIEAPPGESDDFIVESYGKVLGKVGAWRLPEIGFLFDPAIWGRGYAFEALTGFIGRRRALGPGELTADADPRNLASRKLLEKAGFEETGHAANTWLIGGVWHDSIYYRLTL
jgi:RimJ/RimL family protein N-acetyltransferase